MPTTTTRRKPIQTKYKPVTPRKPAPRKPSPRRKPIYYETPAERYEREYAAPERIKRITLFAVSHGLTTLALVILWLVTLLLVPNGHPTFLDVIIAAAFGLNFTFNMFLIFRAGTE